RRDWLQLRSARLPQNNNNVAGYGQTTTKAESGFGKRKLRLKIRRRPTRAKHHFVVREAAKVLNFLETGWAIGPEVLHLKETIAVAFKYTAGLGGARPVLLNQRRMNLQQHVRFGLAENFLHAAQNGRFVTID